MMVTAKPDQCLSSGEKTPNALKYLTAARVLVPYSETRSGFS